MTAVNKTVYSEFQVTEDFSVKGDVLKTSTDALTLKEKNITLQSGDEASITVDGSSMILDLAGNQIVVTANDIALVKGSQQLLINDAGVQVSKLVTDDVMTISNITIPLDGATKVATAANKIVEGSLYKYVISSDEKANAPHFYQFGTLLGSSDGTFGVKILEETVVGATDGDKVIIEVQSIADDTQLVFNQDISARYSEANDTFKFTLTKLC